ncbi:MAG: hypothetical protein JW724_01950 [Candidatus Altiarchaeota archaeon]|nr:hypothetical protein [Candidatus Altiarchaeota archaeon]
MKTHVVEGRCPTGVPGFDEALGGGFLKGRSILLKGDCGTGKSIFAVQFICNGIVRFNEPGVVVLLEQNIKNFKKDVKSFNIDLDRLQEEGHLVIIDTSLSRMNSARATGWKRHDTEAAYKDFFGTKEVVDLVVDAAEEIGAKRVVVDNLPALGNMLQYQRHVREVILYMSYRLQQKGLTTLMISDNLDQKSDDVADYIADGVIVFRNRTGGPDMGRSISIQKMRGTHHNEREIPIEFREGVGVEAVASHG